MCVQLATDCAQRDGLAGTVFAPDQVQLARFDAPAHVQDAANACTAAREHLHASSDVHAHVAAALQASESDTSGAQAPWLPLFEVLQRHPVFPATVADASARALGPRPTTAPPPAADEPPSAACITLHLGATDASHVDATARYMAQHRQRLFWEWQGVPAGPQAAAALRADAESRWAPLSESPPGAQMLNLNEL